MKIFILDLFTKFTVCNCYFIFLMNAFNIFLFFYNIFHRKPPAVNYYYPLVSYLIAYNFYTAKQV